MTPVPVSPLAGPIRGPRPITRNGSSTGCARAAGPRVVVAFDHPSEDAALATAKRIDPARCRVKVGMELFTAAGPAVLEKLHRLGFEVFLDLKFHDIPNSRRRRVPGRRRARRVDDERPRSPAAGA